MAALYICAVQKQNLKESASEVFGFILRHFEFLHPRSDRNSITRHFLDRLEKKHRYLLIGLLQMSFSASLLYLYD